MENANEQMSYPMMDMLAEYFRKKNEPQQAQGPVGVGPVASGDMYGAMLRERAPGSIPLDLGGSSEVPVIQDSPIQETDGERAVRIFKNGPNPDDIKKARMMAGVGLANQDKGYDPIAEAQQSVSKQETVPVKEAAKEMIDKTPLPVEQKEEAKQEVEKSPDTSAPAQTTEGMSPMQKLATIAMALAPTVIGYATHGKKGAYLGAAATGKGLEAGLEQKMQEDKMKIDSSKKAKESVSLKAGKPGGETEDEYGFVYKYDANGKPQPVMIGEGRQLRRANPETQTLTPQGEVITRRKYEGGPSAQVPEVSVKRLSTIGGRVENLLSTAKEKYPNLVIAVPEELSAYQQMNPDDPKTPKPTRERYYRWEREANKRINDYADAMAKAQGKPSVAKGVSSKPSPQELSSIRMYEDEVKKWNAKDWAEYKSKQANAEKFFNQDINKIKSTNVAESPALWFDYMKQIQQDQSVVREGDVATAQRFMDTKQRIDSWLNQYGPNLGSAMTEQMRKDIVDYLKEMRSIKERIAMMDINSMTAKGIRLKFRPETTGVASTAQDAARSWAIKNGINKAPVLGMAANTPIWNKRIPEMVKSGELKNGDFIKDTDGKTFLIKFYSKPENKLGISTVRWVVK